MNNVSLDSLIENGEAILANQRKDYLGRYVDYKQLKEWERLALLFLQTEYP